MTTGYNVARFVTNKPNITGKVMFMNYELGVAQNIARTRLVVTYSQY
jgi:hypothetical protein